MTTSTGHGYRCDKGQMEQGEGERRWKVASSWDKKEKKQGLRWRGKNRLSYLSVCSAQETSNGTIVTLFPVHLNKLQF